MASHDATIKALHEARSSAAMELRSIYAEAAGAELSADQAEAEARAAAEVDTADARIKALLEAREIDAAVEAAAIESAPKVEARTEGDELRSALVEGRGFESRANEQLVGTDSAGGYTVPTSFYDRLIEYMVEYSAAMQAGATVVSTAGGETMEIPTATGYPVATIKGENTPIVNDDVTFGQETVGAWKYTFLSTISSELLQDSAINVEELILRRGAQALGSGFGADMVSGDGSGKPVGLIDGTSGVSTVASASGSVADGFDYGDVLEAVYGVIAPYRAGASFIMNDSVVKALRALVDADGRPLWQPSLQAGGPDTLLGYPVWTDPAMPTATTNGTVGLVFGNIEQAYFARIAGGVRIDSSVESGFVNDVTQIRFIMRADGVVVNADAAVGLEYTT